MAIPATAGYEPPADAAEHAAALMGLSRGNAVRRPDCDAFSDGTWYRKGIKLSIHHIPPSRSCRWVAAHAAAASSLPRSLELERVPAVGVLSPSADPATRLFHEDRAQSR